MDPAEYTIGWICALPLELTAAQGMCEELEYDDSELRKHPRDENKYCLGQIAGHKVVLTCLISAGTHKAGSAARHMQNTFENLSFILMVGIGGGIPSASKDVRLGDVVVSMPDGPYSGVIEYDSGKQLQDRGFLKTGALKAPPKHLQNVVKSLVARHMREDNCIGKNIDEMLRKMPKNPRPGTEYRRPGKGHDFLFEANYVCQRNGDTCADCDKKKLVDRPERLEDEPVMHYGNIASGGTLFRDALKRDQLGKTYGALCVEMEAAGLMDELDCLVIRGICDYSDSHKNKDWQRYAAAAAASYAKELLGDLSRRKLAGSPSSQTTYAPSTQPMPPSPMLSSSKALSKCTWEGREGENVLIDSQLKQYQSHASGSQISDKMRQCDFRIFELRDHRFSIPTRRIAVRSHERGEQITSHWIPLDNVHVEIEDRQLRISWSDCSHILPASRNYRTAFTFHYKPESRNRRLDLELEDVSGLSACPTCHDKSKKPAVIQRVADVLLYPTLEHSHYEQYQILAGSSKIKSLRVYKHSTGSRSANTCADQHPMFAILVSYNATDITRFSKLYFGRPCLDFQLDKVQNLIIFKEMRCLNYISSLEKYSEIDISRHLDQEGRPDEFEYITEDLELSPMNHEGLTIENLMETLTGWRLLFREYAAKIVLRGGGLFGPKWKKEGALVTVWERGTETDRDLQLLVRASSIGREPNDNQWLSASLTSPPVDLTKPEVKSISMEVKACLRGPKFSIDRMSVDASAHSESKAQTIKLQFDESNHANRFLEIYLCVGKKPLARA